MEDNERLPSLDELQAKINKIKKSEGQPSGTSGSKDISQATRIISDLAAGVLVGTGFGYFVDTWLNTTPWVMLAGLVFGVGAGIKNMMRTAEAIDREFENKQMQEKTDKQADKGKSKK